MAEGRPALKRVLAADPRSLGVIWQGARKLVKSGRRLIASVCLRHPRRERIELGDGACTFPDPDFLVLRQREFGDWMMFRFTKSGDFCGDTWHRTIADADEQAVYEYGPTIGAWVEVPDAEQDDVAYASRLALENRLPGPAGGPSQRSV